MQPIPTINVNLTTCKCAGAPEDADPLRDASGHIREFNGRPYCAAAPVLIPCHIPRSVTFEVRMGECACDRLPFDYLRSATGHTPTCPGASVRVSCSISGKTWEESSVVDVEWHPSQSPIVVPVSMASIESACRERWGFVKSLVLGHLLSDCPEVIHNMRAQRDTVYSALADMARAEEAASIAQGQLVNVFAPRPMITRHMPRSDMSVSSAWLCAYVARLIEQVGGLP